MPSRLLIAFAVMTFVTLDAPATARAQNASSGHQVFQSRCSICHSAQPGRIVIGPSLFGVVGRHSGRMQGFQYSAANLQSNLTWDPATLDRYLSDPQQLVPGTLMTFSGLRNPQQRADVIAYLETLR
jgi:cytochrome c